MREFQYWLGTVDKKNVWGQVLRGSDIYTLAELYMKYSVAVTVVQ